METALWWVRNDARLHDNAALAAAADADRLLPVYVVDPRGYGEQPYDGRNSFDFEKTGAFRTRFLQETVDDLRGSLDDAGSALLVREGRPDDVLPEVADAVDADAVHFQALPAPEERDAAGAVVSALSDAGVTTRSHWTHTLHHVADLPDRISGIDDTFTPFRQSVERDSRVRDPVPEPDLPETPDLARLDGVDDSGSDLGSFPTLNELGLPEPAHDDRGVLAFEGGEAAGLDRLDHYLWEGDHLREYKQTRNGMLGPDYSSKLSPWLNAGCLSPRRVAAEVEEYEAERVSNDSTYWLLFELRWRDFMAFQTAKHGGQFFSLGGIRERDDIDWQRPDHDPAAREQFERWARGETGIPFVDATMRELNATGYMSNRGRQNAASFLANSLRVDWRRGAAYFETRLIDYAPGSNYGNWAYIAGVGNDSRNSYFDVVGQAKKYDSDGEYVTHWLPELEPLPAAQVHEPWELNRATQAEYGVVLGEDYPEPMVDLDATYEKFH
ncbi:DASH family cryptochrome [Halolamina litorea]|uniref:Cryptochrome DASH n=1 Tax=Halolamina litorea TaxID=1515593 RepID=A0ABD6BST7_9EURY|nr:DASH family cryptochrome [Halolamina litorea]